MVIQKNNNELDQEISRIINIALEEDRVFADITSDSIIPEDRIIKFEIKTREEIIFCGKDIILEVFKKVKNNRKFIGKDIVFEAHKKDGEFLKENEIIGCGQGNAKLIFASERIILNLIQHLSGISSLANKFVKALDDKKITILDTRKTIPGLRNLQKYACEIGGFKNHRNNLSDLILIKDNHIAAAKGVKQAIEKAKEATQNKFIIEVECDTYNQVKEAIGSNPDIIMLDNMRLEEVKNCSKLIRESKSNIKIEVSGGINIKNIKNYQKLDIDYISTGLVTNSAKSVDIGLDIIE
jgi:nicotinate-nucleotide pyrophosphorylase (carboxylating)